VIAAKPLRFIRSASAPLPPKVMAELEATFGAAVIEAYGMTEAAPQISSNPLPPGKRKPGSVGIAAGPEVVILDESGVRLPATSVGEIAIRGPNVTSGYENNSAANNEAFTSDGWFRTGDRGYFDSEGYLFITGRLKEMINRGGEKISPREIDEALLEHPAVAQALAFAIPHPSLGEDVAAAVVLRPGATATEGDIRQFLSAKLVYFKVPCRVVLLDEIPKGPTGKLQRIGLAQRLGTMDTAPSAAVRTSFAPARDQMEQWLLDLWQEVLAEKRIGINDNFFLMGGDSLTAMQLLARIRESLGVAIPIAAFFSEPTVEALWRLASAAPRAVPGDFNSLLEEIDSLSEEEAERLLKEEMNL
jgi:oxalate---CoA ligase